jgi:preprotein translocase subunit SecD
MKLSWKVWLLIIVLLSSALILSPNFEKGVLIKSVDKNSTVYEEGLRTGMIIKSINSEPINNFEDYTRIISSAFSVEKINASINKSISNSTSNAALQNKTKLILNTKEAEFLLYSNEPPKITVADIPRTKIKTGLDLSGGARALVKPEIPISKTELNDLITITSNRLNAFGISDVSVRAVSDLSGNNFMLVEVAGATPSDLKELVSKQGKFEAKIGNETVFIGGEQDITYVARTGEQSGIYSCDDLPEGSFCSFRFVISLSEQAAKRHANITNKLGINSTNPEYLEKQLDLYLDEKLVESLYIGKDLKGSETTQIMISGSGTGAIKKDAYDNAMADMKHLQTVLITGSLPYKLEIVKLDTISPSLGKEFTKNIIILALIVFIAVSIILFIKYRKIKITLSVILTMFSEAFITLAIASLIKWNLDAPSIAGIIAGMGTGVNDQIVILDESVSNRETSLKERIKSAFFVIITAFLLIIAAMLPLFWAGAGMLKGFALTTIIGVSVGILITRPAFAEIIKQIIKD